MKVFATKQSRGFARARLAFQLSPVAAGCAVFVSAFAGHAFAQTAPAAQVADVPVATVVVSGIRRGIEAAISVKKNATSIVEAISAEDIGKLPDSSIAESIARLPGLTAQSVGGRAVNVSIRGMSGDFSTSLLNGREQVSTSDNRSVEFDQYPSELLGGVVVYKTPDATLIGQGLSGTVDLQTVRPLAFGQRVLVVNARAERDGHGTEFKGAGKRFSASYIDQFADRTIGIALGATRFSSDLTTATAENYDVYTGSTMINGQDVKVVNGFKLFNKTSKKTRDGLMGVLEYRPSKEFHSQLDLFYSKFDDEVVSRGLELQVNDSWKSGNGDPFVASQAPALAPGAVVANGRLVSGTWLNVNPLSRHIYDPTKTELSSVGWNNELRFGDQWTAVLDLSTSSATRKQSISELEAGVVGANGRPLSEAVGIVNGNTISSLQYNHGDPALVKLTDPESWGQNGYTKSISVKDTIKAGRMSFQKGLDGMFSKVTFGLNFSERVKDRNAEEAKLILKTPPSGALPAGAGSVLVGNSKFGSVSFDPAAAFPASYNLIQNINGDILLKGWNVTEKVSTAFVKGDLDTKVAGFDLRGNIGVQMVRTDQQSTAPSVDDTRQDIVSLHTMGKSYTDFLPSANLVFDIGSDQMVRFGVAKVLARARMDQMSAARRSEIDATTRTWKGSGGNPLLDPFRAKAIDVSYEKYFGTKAYVSAAAFYKKLDSYIFEFNDNAYSFTGFPNLSNRTTATPIGKFTQPRNGAGGSIKGIELAASMPFSVIAPMLDGFGAQANMSHNDSKINPFGDTDVRPLPGLSKQVKSLTLYYEKFGFSARVAARQRSDYLGEVQGFGAAREYQFVKGNTVADLQLGYEFQSGMAKGATILLQVLNANKALEQQYQASTGTITKTDDYGRTILFGMNYKF
ncbi:TonB-dependent receptor [Massilia psychrophila]|nr:TonB-dependent receptor [Massilia psychrophila]GGE76730.1 TonB-dependent receptor [Massilia psychrophila]